VTAMDRRGGDRRRPSDNGSARRRPHFPTPNMWSVCSLRWAGVDFGQAGRGNIVGAICQRSPGFHRTPARRIQIFDTHSTIVWPRKLEDVFDALAAPSVMNKELEISASRARTSFDPLNRRMGLSPRL